MNGGKPWARERMLKTWVDSMTWSLNAWQTLHEM